MREISALSERLFSDSDLQARLRTICAFWVPSRADWVLITLVDSFPQVAKVAALAHREHERGALLFEQMEGQPYKPHDRTFWAEATAEIALPIQAGGIHLGTIHLGIAPSRNSLDHMFDEQIAALCGLAIRNAQLFEEQRKISLTFQSAALATELPHIEGLRFDAVYEAAQAEALVGGDWYDAFTVADGRIVLSIGDVAGSGLLAAVAMTSVRQAIRGVA
ncbi:MAG: hypothetical protein M3R30_01230, partial [Candidatus Eremiobacteraeota bacterium]|nr:hypothetical protein [Candidatus Eremiobacteraeota bacterium]